MLDTLSDGLCNVVACQIADIASHVSHAGARMAPRPASPLVTATAGPLLCYV